MYIDFKSNDTVLIPYRYPTNTNTKISNTNIIYKEHIKYEQTYNWMMINNKTNTLTNL